MFGAFQFGLFAAGVVLFVPMGMAGWHLSRNKMLFFSCALFITLFVGVHLVPYFPSVTSFITSQQSSSSSFIVNRDSCFSLLHQVSFDFQELGVNSSDSDIKICSWKWVESENVVNCDFQKLTKNDASDLLNGSWVVIAGDSQARLMVVSLLELLLGESKMEILKGDLFQRHSDYNIFVDEIGFKLDFIWAPYVSNLTDLVLGFKEKTSYPDVFVMGAGLWDMLHVNNASDYGEMLKSLKDSVMLLLPVSSTNDDSNVVPIRLPNLFWLGMPKLINSMLNTDKKKEKMTDVMWQGYNDELNRSKLLQQSGGGGGGPLIVLDVHLLSNNCGAHCTADGMHYHSVVYEAVVHIMLNGLLIESNQKL